MNIVFLVFSVLLFFLVFNVHEHYLQKAEPFAGQEIRAVDWWIKSYNEYHLLGSIFVSTITCLSIFVGINLNVHKPDKMTYFLIALCILIGLFNLSIIISPFFLVYGIFFFFGVCFLSFYLFIKYETATRVKSSLVFMIMILYLLNNIWCLGRYFDLFGD